MTTATNAVPVGEIISFSSLVLPTLLLSGFFVAMGLIILWSVPGLNFDLAIRRKPWRRNVILGLGIYIAALCLLRLAVDVIAVVNGQSHLSVKDMSYPLIFLSFGVGVIVSVLKPAKKIL